MPPASQIQKALSLGHIPDSAESSSGAIRQYQTAYQSNTMNANENENLNSAVYNDKKVDNDDDYISDEGSDGGNSDRNSEATSDAPLDTQTTVFSDQGAYKDTYSQSRAGEPPKLLQENSIGPRASFAQDNDGYLGQPTHRKSISYDKNSKDCASTRSTHPNDLDENGEDVNRDDGDEDCEVKGHARHQESDHRPLSFRTHEPLQPRTAALSHEARDDSRIPQGYDCEMGDDNTATKGYGYNGNVWRLTFPSPIRYQEMPLHKKRSPHNLTPSYQTDNSAPAVVQQGYISRPAAPPEQFFGSNITGACSQNPMWRLFSNLNQNWSHAKRRRNAPTPEPDEDAGPNPRKHIRLSFDDSDRKIHSQKTIRQKILQPRIQPPALATPSFRSKIDDERRISSPTRSPISHAPDEHVRETRYALSPPPLSLETKSKPFDIFTAILAYPDLVLEVSKHLEVDSLVNLYAISRAYHASVDSRFTALIMSQAISKASESARTFHFRAYRNLCKRDPAGRIMLFNVSEKEGIERVATPKDNDVRFVPSFRWLKMILHHEAVVDRILYCLAQEGHRLPKRTTLVLKKLWFTLDITDNGRRIGLLHDTGFWSSKDLFLATMFFVKLDMRLTDPTTGDGEMGLRKMLLAQKSMESLARVLAREELRSQLELVRMIVRFDYTPSRPLLKGETVFGIPAAEVGKLCLEGWGRGDRKLVPIDELIGREAVRRRLNLQNHYIDMMLYGYMDKTKFQDVRTPMNLIPRNGGSEDEDEEDWGTETTCEEMEEENDEKSGLASKGIEKMELFGGDTDEDNEAGGEEDSQEQIQENIMDEQDLGLVENEMCD